MTRALVVIDMQRGFDDLDFWGPTANPDCEANVARLIEAFAGEPVVVVRHDSRHPDSPLHPSNPGNALVDAVATVDAAVLVTKDVNSAFYGDPDLHAWLQERGSGELVLCGITAAEGDQGLAARHRLRIAGEPIPPWPQHTRAHSLCPCAIAHPLRIAFCAIAHPFRKPCQDSAWVMQPPVPLPQAPGSRTWARHIA